MNLRVAFSRAVDKLADKLADHAEHAKLGENEVMGYLAGLMGSVWAAVLWGEFIKERVRTKNKSVVADLREALWQIDSGISDDDSASHLRDRIRNAIQGLEP